ncbi:MAG: hypothetical protein PHC62_00725 [Candidatus Izemoplasmatales bacterium]|nr:hypothetical protein [Candidatus Izemoplasmatales bacterium]
MNHCFPDMSEIENKKSLNLATTIKILLHKYFYSNNADVLNLIQDIRNDVEASDVNYNHINRTFTVKFTKNVIKKWKKLYKTEEMDTECLYDLFSKTFQNFFNEIDERFEQLIGSLPEFDQEEKLQLRESYDFYRQNPDSIKFLTHIVSLLEDNYVVICV